MKPANFPVKINIAEKLYRVTINTHGISIFACHTNIYTAIGKALDYLDTEYTAKIKRESIE